MNKKNYVTTRIFGSEYTIVGTESKEYISEVCKNVNEKMNSIANRPNINPLRAAVLCAINLCDELFKSRKGKDDIIFENERLKKDYSDLRIKNKVLNEENEYLKDEIKSLQSKLSENINEKRK